jgi:hypothetical protein
MNPGFCLFRAGRTVAHTGDGLVNVALLRLQGTLTGQGRRACGASRDVSAMPG